MAHNPINHPARPVYRSIGGLIGLYLVVFGLLGIGRTAGAPLWARDDTVVLGQGANLGSSVLAGVVGLVLLIATGLGRNIDVAVNKFFGYALMTLGLAALSFLRTDANYLNYSVATCVVTMLIGLALLTAGMYGKVGSDEDNRAWQDARLTL